RLQALCTLDGLHSVDAGVLIVALIDADPAVGEHAIRISESVVGGSDKNSGRLEKVLLHLIYDPDIRVRYQLALSLGELKIAQAGRALAELAWQSVEDERLLVAVKTSASNHLVDIMTSFGTKSRLAVGSHLDEHGKLAPDLQRMAIWRDL